MTKQNLKMSDVEIEIMNLSKKLGCFQSLKCLYESKNEPLTYTDILNKTGIALGSLYPAILYLEKEGFITWNRKFRMIKLTDLGFNFAKGYINMIEFIDQAVDKHIDIILKNSLI